MVPEASSEIGSETEPARDKRKHTRTRALPKANDRSGDDRFIDNDEETARRVREELGEEAAKPTPCGDSSDENKGRFHLTRRWKIAYIIATSALFGLLATLIWEEIEDARRDTAQFQDTWFSEQESIIWPEAKQGRGLELMIVKSVSSDWDDIFYQAVNDWVAAPALSLNTSSFDDEETISSCDHIKGAIIVCNGDYGDTGWLGVNELYYYEEQENKYIVSSAAKMNDHYLKRARNSQRRYVMCHELGHGFGLPHRDEILDNRDLGSCLDYTNNYSVNMKPDTDVDFDNLSDTYGNIIVNETRTLSGISIGQNEENEIYNNLGNTIINADQNHGEGSVVHQSERTTIFERRIGRGLLKMRTTVLHARKR